MGIEIFFGILDPKLKPETRHLLPESDPKKIPTRPEPEKKIQNPNPTQNQLLATQRDTIHITMV